MADTKQTGGTPYLGADTTPRVIIPDSAIPALLPVERKTQIADYNQLLVSNLKTNLNSGSSGTAPPTFQLQPFGSYPEGHEPFDIIQQGTIPAIAGAAVVVLLLNIPNGFTAIIERYSINFAGTGGPINYGDLVWRMFIGTTVVKNFEAIQSERGTIQIPRNISNLKFDGNQVFTITVEHIANAGLSGLSVASISGYTYPTTNLTGT